MNRKEAGAKIRIARIMKGFSQEELAKRLNVSQVTVCLWENGITFPRANNLVKVSGLLGIRVDELLKVG